jgi:c-di-AMP phosphodiesterase-like protein
MKKKEQPFTIQERPLEEIVTFLKDKDPSIIGNTCQMLSAIKMTMHPEQGLKYLIGVIEQIRQNEKYKFKEDTLSQLQLDALDNENYTSENLEDRGMGSLNSRVPG